MSRRPLTSIPHYDDDAMAYMNLLIRYKADLSDSPEEYKKQSASC